MTEEIKGVTFDFDGARLNPWQAAQRLYKAGFVDAKLCAIGYAVMMGESGRYLKAWHHNVVRNEDETIKYESDGKMTIKSTDLGFIQKNIPHNPNMLVFPQDAASFTNSLFLQYPELADGQKSAEIAWELFIDRGWQPWYAHSNGSYKNGLPSACVAVGKYLAMSLANDPEIVIHNPKYLTN